MNSPISDPEFFQQRMAMPAEFVDVFSHFYYVLNSSNEAVEQKLLPTFQTILVFSLNGEVTLKSDRQNLIIKQVVIISCIKKLLTYTVPPNAEILVVNFKLDSFYRFFGHKLKPHEDFIVHPDILFDDDGFSNLWQKIKQPLSLQEKTNVVLEFCRPYLKDRPASSEQFVSHAIENSCNPVKTAAEIKLERSHDPA